MSSNSPTPAITRSEAASGLRTVMLTDRNSIASVIANNPSLVLVPIMAIGLFYWVWVGLSQRSIISGEAISIVAAQSILEHGYQLFPSGFLYHRGYASHYILAGSFAIFGVNNFSIMLPALIMGLGSKVLVYRIARDIAGLPWVGVAAAVLLFTLQEQSFYATSPRMYMSLQFFTLLFVYSAWRGYIRGEGKFQLLALLAVSLAMLSHRQAASLVIAAPAAVIGASWISSRRLPTVKIASNLVGGVVLAATLFFIFLYDPAGAMPNLTAHAGRPPG